MTINEFFVEHPQAAIAFSGGVDSAYLLYAACKYAEKVQAYYVKTAFQPQFEIDDALRIGKELNINIKVIELDVLADENVAANPFNRCYYCKKQIFSAIIREAEKDGFSILLDGTNASDDADDRPGMKALTELSVLSPLRICGLTKSEIRRLSKEAELFTWDKPAYACLATRIPSENRINEYLLQRTERAENYLFSIGFRDFRVRTAGDGAKIQIRESQISMLIKNREKIIDKLLKEYKSVCLDLEVRNEQ